MHLLGFSFHSGRFYGHDIGFWGEIGVVLGWDVREFLMEAVRKYRKGCVTVLTRTRSWLTQTRGDRNMALRRLTHTSPSLTGAPLTYHRRRLPRPALSECLYSQFHPLHVCVALQHPGSGIRPLLMFSCKTIKKCCLCSVVWGQTKISLVAKTGSEDKCLSNC